MRLTIHVRPLSRETRLVRERDGTFTMHAAAPPTRGRANRARYVRRPTDRGNSP